MYCKIQSPLVLCVVCKVQLRTLVLMKAEKDQIESSHRTVILRVLGLWSSNLDKSWKEIRKKCYSPCPCWNCKNKVGCRIDNSIVKNKKGKRWYIFEMQFYFVFWISVLSFFPKCMIFARRSYRLPSEGRKYGPQWEHLWDEFRHRLYLNMDIK